MQLKREPMIYISLRPLRESDLLSFSKWATDPLVTQSLLWDAYSSEEEMKLFLQDVVEPHPWFMAIVYNDQVVGSITINCDKGKNRCKGELGYALAREYWGKGICTRAVIQALDRAFQELNLNRIECFIDPDNIASIRVCEKAGMVREGLLKNYIIHKGKLRDRYIYASYRKEANPSSSDNPSYH